MCLAKDETNSPRKMSPPRSPWSKLLGRQSSKPRIPRKGTTSARVNLNKCWSKLGELISNSGPRADLPTLKNSHSEEPTVVSFSNYFYPMDPVKPVPVKDDDNAANQNLVNSNRFELLEEHLEINDNITNEVREICYATANQTCYVCNFCY